MLATALGAIHLSTDWAARHPGRPWKTESRPAVPEDVAEHYRTLPVKLLVDEVMRHYREAVWPKVEVIVESHAMDSSSDRLIVEGSAILPDLVASLRVDRVFAVWLTCDSMLLRDRIRESSRYDALPSDERLLVDKFIGRNEIFNRRVLESARELGFASIDVGAAGSVDHVVGRLIALAIPKRLQG